MATERDAVLFKSGNSVAVRIPREWVPPSREVRLRKEGASIVISPKREPVVDLAARFAADGEIEFSIERPRRTPRAPRV
jgi:virulence-associated protein VagC